MKVSVHELTLNHTSKIYGQIYDQYHQGYLHVDNLSELGDLISSETPNVYYLIEKNIRTHKIEVVSP